MPADLIQKTFRLEWLTIGLGDGEAGVALVAGATADSGTLLAFGIDSLIELTSASVLIWRLEAERRNDAQFSERAERIASRTSGALLLGLAGCIVVEAILSLLAHRGGSFSVPGLLVAPAAIPVMYGRIVKDPRGCLIRRPEEVEECVSANVVNPVVTGDALSARRISMSSAQQCYPSGSV